MAITGSTNTPAPQNRNESEFSGAAALPTVTKYGIMYGQNITASESKAATKNTAVNANGQLSRRRRAATKTPYMANNSAAGKTRPQWRLSSRFPVIRARSIKAATTAIPSTTNAAPASKG